MSGYQKRVGSVQHGVFVIVNTLGVLIIGPAGIGKSELALSLITRGHTLVADDAPEFSVATDQEVIGSCPELLQDFLEIRGLGLLNIRRLFGDSAIQETHRLDLIIDLRPDGIPVQTGDQIQRLENEHSQRRICGISFPVICPGPAPGRNLTVLVETAVSNHLLIRSGYNPLEEFQNRLRKRMKGNG